VAGDPIGSVCQQYDGDPIELPDGVYAGGFSAANGRQHGADRRLKDAARNRIWTM